IMPHTVERFSRSNPHRVLHIDELSPITRDLSGLRERKYDLLMGRANKPLEKESFGHDVSVETLFDDRFVVACAKDSRWTRRRKIDLAELVDARWVLTAPETLGYTGVAETFRLRGLAMPEVIVITSSVLIANHLLATKEALTVTSRFAAEAAGLHVLPIDLGLGSWPALIFTLKNRKLNPLAERFIACAREVAKSMSNRRNRRTQARTSAA